MELGKDVGIGNYWMQRLSYLVQCTEVLNWAIFTIWLLDREYRCVPGGLTLNEDAHIFQPFKMCLNAYLSFPGNRVLSKLLWLGSGL